MSGAGTYYVKVEVFNLYSTQTNVIFTYSVQAPLIISLSPSSGGTGTSLTITGANFLTGSTVGFCTVNGNGCGSGQTAATVVSLTSTQITVTVPGLAPGNYYPIVTLPPAYSSTPPSQPYNQPADIFTHT